MQIIDKERIKDYIIYFKPLIIGICLTLVCFCWFYAGAGFSCVSGGGRLENFKCIGFKVIEVCQFEDKYYLIKNDTIPLVLSVPNEKETYILPDVKEKLTMNQLLTNYTGHLRPYINGTYTCQNYTSEFINYSNENGAYCRYIIGCKEDNLSCHAWARCDIETQTLNLIDYNKLYPNQRSE